MSKNASALHQFKRLQVALGYDSRDDGMDWDALVRKVELLRSDSRQQAAILGSISDILGPQEHGGKPPFISLPKKVTDLKDSDDKHRLECLAAKAECYDMSKRLNGHTP